MDIQTVETHKIFNGTQTKYRHFSTTLNCDMIFSLFLPQTTEIQEISLVWWLSGLTCNDDNFSQKGQFQQYADKYKVAVAIPDTSPRGDSVADDENWDLGQGASFYLNATQDPWKQNYQMYDYLTQELPSIIYHLIPNFSGRESIMGHSMGGHGALTIGLKNPQRFAAISAFAPITNPIHTPWGNKAFTAYLGTDKNTWENWDATTLLANCSTVPPIYITQGTADNFYDVQLNEVAFLKTAETKQANVRYQKVEGYDHSYFTIATFIGEHFAFHHACLE
ncbi:S-formylglutathione hydrolase [Enterococcus saccharolyticus]|uniref:S-formylglutathione hydrolase n=1 Tax=Enterococcus saccharolyticus subsp. saccharolyticus ATCC 43076 TaxID=1139996 RepID=S0JK47_9ENTE|nr:S-formylglutathione hydrolase [Enterococcus saccharolyticus]EOT28865.1 S-formylglutathione hydrolase [Enterococcus saccharolyticus subsp. saccharolyticus ATCC 43076]EOT81231.1 S-formylglutathione hydrolase [Enterococcus saccharolyticus subsp. saccharolyticus ATCC 43076]OJG90234.1 S-formylglutathione hydrolase [Enterococcus saccharolyticus]